MPRLMGPKLALVLSSVLLSFGCFAGVHAANAEGGGTDFAQGEQHDVGYSAQDAFIRTQDVLRGEGIEFDIEPNNRLQTLWKPGDQPPSILGDLFGVRPQYRYEIEVVPTGPRQSRIVANLRAEDIPEQQLEAYSVTKRLDLFNKLDQLAAKEPPPSAAPRTGGVNFALLPGENLRALAKRTTGNADNWRIIATENGLTSPDNLQGVESVWVPEQLLSQGKEPR